MSDQAETGSKFVYVSFIRTTAERLWEALTEPDFNRVYWFGMWQDSEWQPGSSWRLVYPDGRVADSGTVVESDKPHRLVISWRNEWQPQMKAEGFSRATFALEPAGDTVKLTVTHEIERAGSIFIEAVSGGWPKILSGLKSLLETGTPLNIPHSKAAR